jgi:hypothetical protein
MTAPLNESGTHKELAAAVMAPPSPVLAPVQTPLQPKMSTPLVPAAAAGASAALQSIQNTTTRALAEAMYQMRRIGMAATAGIAAVVLAATLFLANNLPQGAAVAALKSQLLRMAPVGKGASVALPVGVGLASLPPRGEAPNVVAKILEEANAAGVGLPRGQYEYVPARDGVAARYRMTFPLRASYPKIREFMDRTLIALPAVAVEGLRIERKNVGDDSVDAELKLSAYVRSEE